MDRWGGMTALMFHGTVYPLVHKLSHPPIDSLHSSMFWHCLGIPNLWERKHPIIFALYGAAIRVKKLCRIWITVGRNKSDCYKSSLHVWSYACFHCTSPQFRQNLAFSDWPVASSPLPPQPIPLQAGRLAPTISPFRVTCLPFHCFDDTLTLQLQSLELHSQSRLNGLTNVRGDFILEDSRKAKVFMHLCFMM